MARPRFKPTDEQRRNVQALAGMRMPEEDIARLVGPNGIDPKTLRKHFPSELDRGPAIARAKVKQTFLQEATSGRSVKATLEWDRRYGGWKENPAGQQENPSEKSEESENELDQRITDVVTRIRAARGVSSVPGEPKQATEAEAASQVEGLDRAA
jgi:hypothetical protein